MTTVLATPPAAVTRRGTRPTGGISTGRRLSTPTLLQLLLALVAVLCVVCGTLGAVVAARSAGAAHQLTTTTVPAEVDAATVYTSIADADATAATAFLAGGLEPPALRATYDADIASAGTALASIGAPPTGTTAATALADISARLPVYTGLIETARANNRQGFPVGGAYLSTASDIAQTTLLADADTLLGYEQGRVSAGYTDARSTGTTALLFVALVVLGIVLVLGQLVLTRRTRRALNPALALATVLTLVALVATAGVVAVARDRLDKGANASSQIALLTAAQIDALKEKGDESLTLVGRGDDSHDAAVHEGLHRHHGQAARIEPGSLPRPPDARPDAARGRHVAGAAVPQRPPAGHGGHRQRRLRRLRQGADAGGGSLRNPRQRPREDERRRPLGLRGEGEQHAAPARRAGHRHTRPRGARAADRRGRNPPAVEGVPMRRALVAVAVAGSLAACGGAATNRSASVGAAAPTPAATPAATPAPTCDAVASLKPTSALPAAGKVTSSNPLLAKILSQGYITAGVAQDTLLFGYRNSMNDTIEGFDIDMLKQVALELFGSDGTDRLHLKVISYADRVSDVQTGVVDIVADTMTINCMREQSVDFSTVYYDAGQKVLVQKGSPAKSVADLGGKKICAAVGSTSLDNLKALTPAVVPVGVATQADCLVQFQLGTVDAISTDDTILLGLTAQDPYAAIVGASVHRRALRHGGQQVGPRPDPAGQRRARQGARRRHLGLHLQPLAGRLRPDAGPAAGGLQVTAPEVQLSTLDATLARFRAAAETASARLLDLDGDPTTALLTTGPLTGMTAGRWALASAAQARLWTSRDLLSTLVSDAEAIRGDGRKPGRDEQRSLVALLTGQSVTLETVEVPPAQRSLLGPSQGGQTVLGRRAAGLDDRRLRDGQPDRRRGGGGVGTAGGGDREPAHRHRRAGGRRRPSGCDRERPGGRRAPTHRAARHAQHPGRRRPTGHRQGRVRRARGRARAGQGRAVVGGRAGGDPARAAGEGARGPRRAPRPAHQDRVPAPAGGGGHQRHAGGPGRAARRRGDLRRALRPRGARRRRARALGAAPG